MLQFWISLSERSSSGHKVLFKCVCMRADSCYETCNGADGIGILSFQDGDSLTFGAPSLPCGDRLPVGIGFDFVVFIPNASSHHNVLGCLTSSLRVRLHRYSGFPLPTCSFAGLTLPALASASFFMGQLEGSAAWRAGTLPDGVATPGYTSESVSKDMSVLAAHIWVQ